MTATRSILALLAALSVAAPALAQTPTTGADEAVSTAAHRVDAKTAAEAEKIQAELAARAAATPAPRALTTEEQIAAFLATSPAIERGEGLVGARPSEDEKRKIHGSAGVTIGTGGYRSAYVSTLIPIGETATLGIALSQTDHGKNAVYRPYYDGFGYGADRGWGYDSLSGEGYGPGRPGRWSRGGKSQSVAVSLAVGDRDARPPEGCAPAFRADGRYVEPPWATQMRGDRNPCDLTDVH
ncbi:hypothetical protein [Caulobacter sp.]|uniref:hypothetical protein n=1 Tax=Caulobacter sp. TaxID=78 RepID=UPI003BA952E6